jgi:glycerol uptake facilitator protein
MMVYLAEALGTTLLIFLGIGVGANVNLKKSKGHDSGLIVVALGWSCAVVVATLIFGPICEGHFNSAFTLSLAIIGKFPWAKVPGYFLAHLTGSILGALLVYLHYKDHFDHTEDSGTILSVFATGPAIRNFRNNFICEFLGTFVFVFTVLGICNTSTDEASLKAFSSGIIVFVISVSLNGPTGSALNPTRDFGPRLLHSLLPLKHKGSSDWAYAWIPIVAPILGALSAALLSNWLFPS